MSSGPRFPLSPDATCPEPRHYQLPGLLPLGSPSTLSGRDLGAPELRSQAALCEIVVFLSPGKGSSGVPLSVLLQGMTSMRGRASSHPLGQPLGQLSNILT